MIQIRGNHETGGNFKQGKINEDVADLEIVVEYLKSKFGYKIDILIGHSRGSVVALHWACKSEDGRRISALVNISGRYRMSVSDMTSLKYPTPINLIRDYPYSESTVNKLSRRIMIFI